MFEQKFKHEKRIVGFIFRAYITLKDGTRIYARDYGLRAFRIPIFADRE